MKTGKLNRRPGFPPGSRSRAVALEAASMDEGDDRRRKRRRKRVVQQAVLYRILDKQSISVQYGCVQCGALYAHMYI